MSGRTASTVRVNSVHHWNDTLFSFKTTRQPTMTFENGQFVMIGLQIDDRPLLRAYSIASPNYADELEFFSIKVPDGALTSRLQHLRKGDEVLVTSKPTGTLVPGHLLPGKHLYLLSTGTGLAPFMSVIQDPFIYDEYDKVILVHGTRWISELAYQDFICNELPQNEYFGDVISEKLIYYPTVTREAYVFHDRKHVGRITQLLSSGLLAHNVGLSAVTPENDRFMLCGNDSMLKDLMKILDGKGFKKANSRNQGHYVIEQAFIEK
ncbi:MAG: ferredoxin--NADP reductase [Pseudomonadota bacterium]